MINHYINLCKVFISRKESLLIAPAGCGKTYTIAECLRYTEGLHLILTHTHAGVASLKEKMDKGNTVKAAELLGQILAEQAKVKGITKVVFDRGGYIYHGRVKGLAESARKHGLEF